MRLWIDDIRKPEDHGWADAHWARTAHEGNTMLRTRLVTEVSFDHDLGTGPSGYTCATLVKKLVAQGKIPCPKWAVHSANPIGRKRIEAAMRSAEKLAQPVS